MASNVILLAIDSRSERKWFQDVLSAAGHRVIAVDNGARALVRAKEFVPDLVLMETELTGLNGLSATRAIKSDPRSSDVPVILVLDAGKEADRLRAIEQGARDVVFRPVDQDELLSKVLAWSALFNNTNTPQAGAAKVGDRPAPWMQPKRVAGRGGSAIWIAGLSVVLGLGMLAFGLIKNRELGTLRSELSEVKQEAGVAADMAVMIARKLEREDGDGALALVPAALNTPVDGAGLDAGQSLMTVNAGLGAQQPAAKVNGGAGPTAASEAPEPFVTESAISAAAAEPKPEPSPANKKLDEIHFTSGKPSLSPGAQRKTRAAAVAFLNGSFEKLKVIGFADTTGGGARNLELSHLRANSVASELLRAGVPMEKIQIIAKGEDQLPEPTGNNVDEPLNRCVGIIAVR